MSLPPLVELFENDIEAVIAKYEGAGLTVSEAIGTLHLIATRLAMDAIADDEAGGSL